MIPTPSIVPPYPSPLVTDADRRAAAVLAEWMIELGLDEDMLAVAQEGFEHHLAMHRESALQRDSDLRERQRVDTEWMEEMGASS